MYEVINMRENYHQRQGLIDLCDYLNQHIELSNSPFVEIGCYQGESSEIFAERVGHLTCIDIWDNIDGLLDATTSIYPMNQVESNFNMRMSKFINFFKIKGDFYNQVAIYDIPCKVVYVDANHEYEHVLNDLRKVNTRHGLWRPEYICGHDYTEGWPGVIRAVNEVFGNPLKTFQDGSWVVKYK